jgi:hypothetical protein
MTHLAIALFSLTLLAAPLTVHAQQPGRVYRIGVTMSYAPVSKAFSDPGSLAFLEVLRAHGYSQGRNLAVRWT